MKSKQPKQSPQNAERGAPAALRAVEDHELQCRNEKDAAWEKRHKAALELASSPDDELLTKTYNVANSKYIAALPIWDEALKRLAMFDKGVKEERREGEKMDVQDAKEYFKQYNLTIDLALEAWMISVSQIAPLCKSPEGFYQQSANKLRDAKRGALDAALRDGALPKWIDL
jgi:hypothetical protein